MSVGQPGGGTDNAYWSTISCSKSSMSCSVRGTRKDDRLRTTASVIGRPAHQMGAHARDTAKASRFPMKRRILRAFE